MKFRRLSRVGLFRRALAALLACAMLFGSLVSLQAQDPPPMPPAPTPDERAAAEADTPLREQTIYIPYTKLRQTFEKEGRGVFLPYDKFQQLWKAAQAAQVKPGEAPPPLAALITLVDSEAVVAKDVVNVSATVTIEILKEGWNEVPLRLRGAAVRSATIAGKPARLLYDDAVGYKLLYENPTKKPLMIELKLDYAAAYAKAPGTNSVSFEAPQAPVNRWVVRVPEAGAKINVHPKLASIDGMTEMTVADEADPEADPDKPADKPKPETKVEAFVGAAPTVRIDWTAKAEGATGLAALATVQVRQELIVDEGVVRTRAQLAYEISRAELSELSIEAPADHDVVNVFDDNVKSWDKKVNGETQTITIQLFQPAKGAQNITLELEKFFGDKEMPQEMVRQEVRTPVLRVLGVGRQQGIVVVRLAESLRAEVTTRNGLLQIDPAELPAPLAGQPWAFSYRYAALPYDLVLDVEKVQPQIEADQLVEVYVEPEQVTLNLTAIYNIERAGVFQLQVEIPEGYEVRTVQGRDLNGVPGVLVDSHHVEKAADAKSASILLVNLGRKAIGKVALFVELFKRQEDANLLTPTGKASVINVPTLRVAPASVARSTGKLLVYAPESLRINPKEQVGVRAVPQSEAVQTVASQRAGRFPLLRELLAFGFTQEPMSLIVDAERRKPSITARQLLQVSVEQGQVKYDSMLYFDILYSGVKTLRVDIPKKLYDSKELRNQTPTIRDRALDPQPADVAEGYTAVELTGDGELLGNLAVRFTWDQKLSQLEVGKSAKIDVPRFVVPNVERSWGQITIGKSETIEIGIDGEPKGLRPIDPQRDLMPGASVPTAARAFEFHDDWSLTLLATRYELEEVKRTSVERAVARMVITRGEQVSAQVLYRLRSARQRIAIKLPAGVDGSTAFDAQSLRINNTPTPLETDGSGTYYIPLVGQTPDAPVLVELRYTFAGGARHLELPSFPEDPAVQQVTMLVYLPEEAMLLAYGGPWNDEEARVWPYEHQSTPDDHIYLNELRNGVSGCSAAGDDFPRDGKRWVFTSLNPPAGDPGALKLTAANRTAVHGGMFLIIALVGVVLAMRPLSYRLWYLALLVVLVVLSAVFAPTFSRAVLGSVLWAAVGLVVLIWLVRDLIANWPRILLWLTMPRFHRMATATAVAAAASASGGTTSAGSQPASYASSRPTVIENPFATGAPPPTTPPTTPPVTPPPDDKQDDRQEGGERDE